MKYWFIIIATVSFCIGMGLSSPKTNSNVRITKESLETIYHLGYLEGALDGTRGTVETNEKKIKQKLHDVFENKEVGND